MSQRRPFLLILAAAGLLLLVQQLADLAPILSDTDLATPSGRVRLVTILAGRSSPFLLADVFLVWAALALSRGGAVRVFGALHLMLGVLMVVATPFFLLDAGHLAGAISGAEVAAYRVIVVRTLGVLAVLGLSALVAGGAIWRLGRAIPAGV
jgi:hypothetical protein